jgi:hypothetical protein
MDWHLSRRWCSNTFRIVGMPMANLPCVSATKVVMHDTLQLGFVRYSHVSVSSL